MTIKNMAANGPYYKSLEKILGGRADSGLELSDEEQEALQRATGDLPENYPWIFQHKLADRSSTFPGFYSKVIQHCDPQYEKSPVIDCFYPHYKVLFR